MTRIIEYFFSISSPWAYIGTDRLIALAERLDVAIKPLLITTIGENGWIPLKNKPAARQRYARADIGRWCRHLGVAMQQDRPADLKDPTPAAKMVVAAEAAGADGLSLAVALQRAYWQEAADIGDPAIRRRIADAMGLDGRRLLDDENAPAVAARFDANRTRAIECGVFGSPTYLFGGELYWGQDRLDFLERHIVTGAPI
jgi:2-hydroxychromene-2-carboxylate isomerase